MTPKDYLENSLSAVQGDTEEIMEKNKVKPHSDNSHNLLADQTSYS